ncbi:concanavalin A-like lectin/glucanase domain-containing protein [Artemisia annua]|uniref:Concanavalin A-like lectin/glucanase domain-containing protein n=1 Tax=Artemisia annua TaxID=35608 RepID=A0A2U1LKU1_ARTAN|nr:concanavalin A-like lectin/glucanase domain-containing protein [Artemisia annua]
MILLFQAYHVLLVIFLSLTTSSIAYPNYAKPGCKDTYGNVRIPYPFGIGANCSVNEWYIVECNSSTPYLSALNNHLEVLGVDLENQTITVNMPNFSECIQTKKVDLSKSPFLLLESYNKVMDDPVSLLWTLSDCDKDQVSCCDNYNPRGYKRKVDIGNGTSVDSWKCAYYEFYEGTPYLRDGCEGVGISMGSLFLAAVIYASYKLIKKTRTRRRRESVSKHTNGTLLLKQQEEANPSAVDQMSLFISCEGEGQRLL